MGWEVAFIIPVLTIGAYVVLRRRRHGLFIAYTIAFALTLTAGLASNVAAHLDDAMTAAMLSFTAVINTVLLLTLAVFDFMDAVKRRW